MLSSDELIKIYDENFEKIYRFFYYKFLSKSIAEDLTSETFVNFVEQNKKSQKEIQSYKAYLFGIMKNVYMVYLKEKYKLGIQFNPEFEQDFGSTVDEAIDEIEESPTIEDIALKFINKLPDKQKEIVHMRFIEKCSLKEICSKLGKNMNYVKTTQKRALKSLKNLVACTPRLT